MAIDPITRREMFMAKAAGENVNVPEPITREEMFLKNMADNSVSKYFGESTEVLLEEDVEIGSTLTKKLNGYADVKVGDIVKVTFNGVEYLLEAYERTNGCAFGNKAIAFSDGEDTGEPFAVFCIYSASVSQLKVFSEGLHKTHTLKIEKIIVDTIEPKYLPNGGKGIGYEENKVLFDQRVEFTDLGNGMMVFDGDPFGQLEIGKTYTVTYNGEKYNCVAFDAPDDGTEVAIGNSIIFGMDTGEPFLIVTGFDGGDIQEYFFSILSLNGDTSATIRIEKSVIHTIDPKFIPAGVGGGVVIVQDSAMASGVAVVDQDPPTATMNAAQIAEAVQAGKTVYFLTPTDEAVLVPLAYIYLYPALVSGAMTVSTLPKPYVQFGAISEGGYISYNVYTDGRYANGGSMD